MEQENPKAGIPTASKKIRRLSTWFGLLAGGVLLAYGVLYAASDAACDATTGATVRVSGITTTTSGATIAWSEGEHGSQRYFCLGTSPNPTSCALVQSRAGGTKLQTVTGLNASTKYYYQFYGIHGGTTHKSIVNGSFVTDGSSCGTLINSLVEVNGYVLTTGGDSLAKAKVTITGATTLTSITTPSGAYHFQVSPGTYTLSVALAPFTPPTPYRASVVANKPLAVPDLIMTGAYQIAGAVVSFSNPKDSLIGAIVVLKNGASVIATDTTDANGLYSFVAVSGTFSVGVTYNDPSTGSVWSLSGASPTLTVAGSDVKVPILTVGATTGISHTPWYLQTTPGLVPGLRYDGNGIRVGDRSSHKVIFSK